MEKQITEYNKKVDKSKDRPVCIVKNNNELSQCLEDKHIAMIILLRADIVCRT